MAQCGKAQDILQVMPSHASDGSTDDVPQHHDPEFLGRGLHRSFTATPQSSAVAPLDCQVHVQQAPGANYAVIGSPANGDNVYSCTGRSTISGA